jgi:hypothetical protein
VLEQIGSVLGDGKVGEGISMLLRSYSDYIMDHIVRVLRYDKKFHWAKLVRREISYPLVLEVDLSFKGIMGMLEIGFRGSGGMEMGVGWVEVMEDTVELLLQALDANHRMPALHLPV